QHLTAELHTLRAQAEAAREAHEQEANALREEVAALVQQRDRALRDAEEARARLELVAVAQAAGQWVLLEAQREARESQEQQRRL
ncbi:CROCC protein, partial [Alectura lathami]|nr:CROCC protein [Alectura lathami]